MNRQAAEPGEAAHPVERLLADDASWRGRLMRGTTLTLGIVLTQAVLYGPSLAGFKILLPLDVLRARNVYLPQPPELQNYRPQNRVFADEVLAIEFRRRFAAEEVRNGRIPLWNPYNYCGAPFIAANNTAVFSPFRIADYLFPGPWTIAWVQVIKSLVAGIGTYFFLRRTLGIGFWAAALAAWSFPLIGFLIYWRGYPPSFVVVWLPWLLLATDGAVRRPGGLAGPGLALVTTFVLVSGHMAVAAHVLLASGAYFLWCLFDEHGWRGIVSRGAVKSVVATCVGWVLGFVLSAPQSLPTAEYMQQSHRVLRRQSGHTFEVDLFRIGYSALPLFVLPNCYGSWQRDSRWIAPGGDWSSGAYSGPGNPLESAGAGYAGLLTALVLAPLGWSIRSRRSAFLFWLAFGLFAACYLLKVPGISELFALPPLKLLKNNRFVFVTSFAVIVLGAMGLDALWRGAARWRWWFWAFPTVLVGLFLWSAYRFFVPPEAIVRGLPNVGIDPATVQASFRLVYLSNAVICLTALGVWVVLRIGGFVHLAMRLGLVTLVVAEILWNQFGVNPQGDPELYYPEIPALAQLEERTQQPEGQGRAAGFRCLPACLNQVYDLRDFRGYDGADPALIVVLLQSLEQQLGGLIYTKPDYALTQYFPAVDSPVFDMLGVRYRIYRGSPGPSEEPLFSSYDYYVTESDSSLPRAYIPRRVQVLEHEGKVLEQVVSVGFDPRDVAYVARGVDLDENNIAEGTVTIVEEVPSRITVDLDMKTPGLVVLSDLWFSGWNAYLDGEKVPIVRTNFAIRGVVVPAGKGTLEFRYEPESFALGLRLAIIGGGVLAVWCAFAASRRRT